MFMAAEYLTKHLPLSKAAVTSLVSSSCLSVKQIILFRFCSTSVFNTAALRLWCGPWEDESSLCKHCQFIIIPEAFLYSDSFTHSSTIQTSGHSLPSSLTCFDSPKLHPGFFLNIMWTPHILVDRRKKLELHTVCMSPWCNLQELECNPFPDQYTEPFCHQNRYCYTDFLKLGWIFRWCELGKTAFLFCGGKKRQRLQQVCSKCMEFSDSGTKIPKPDVFRKTSALHRVQGCGIHSVRNHQTSQPTFD